MAKTPSPEWEALLARMRLHGWSPPVTAEEEVAAESTAILAGVRERAVAALQRARSWNAIHTRVGLVYAFHELANEFGIGVTWKEGNRSRGDGVVRMVFHGGAPATRKIILDVIQEQLPVGILAEEVEP